MSSADLHQTTRAPYVASMKRRQAAEAPSRWWASCPRVNLDQHLNLVAVDFIGGDGAEGSIPCLEDDDRDHERGGEGGCEGVCILAPVLEAGDHPPRDRTPQARRLADITGCVRPRK